MISSGLPGEQFHLIDHPHTPRTEGGQELLAREERGRDLGP